MTSAGAASADRGRLFVALDLDEAARSALIAWRAQAIPDHPRVRPVAEDALHLTLCFLGTCAMADVEAIAAACAVDSGGPLTGLHLGAAVWLPRRRPRVLAVRIEDESGALARVQAAIAEGLAEGGWYRPEARPYLAHVTVARIARDGPLRPPQPPPPPPVTLADTATVTLYRSHLGRGGSRYERLREIAIDAPAGSGPVGAAPG